MSQFRNPVGHQEHILTHRDALRQWSGSNKDKYKVASIAIAEFKRIGIAACVFGSLAFRLLGVGCKPNDVDIIVLNTARTLEDHKLFLVRTHSGFYLLPSRKPRANYRVLWYATDRGARVKVDILQPGAMSVPDFAPTDISLPRFRIPVAPPDIVLLLKLQGWDYHRLSSISQYNNKQHADVDQILDLLEFVHIDIDWTHLPEDFLQKSQKRVYNFVYQYPDSKYFWAMLGFKVVRLANRRRRMRS